MREVTEQRHSPEELITKQVIDHLEQAVGKFSALVTEMAGHAGTPQPRGQARPTRPQARQRAASKIDA